MTDERRETLISRRDALEIDLQLARHEAARLNLRRRQLRKRRVGPAGLAMKARYIDRLDADIKAMENAAELLESEMKDIEDELHRTGLRDEDERTEDHGDD